ncbi:unnamed protein product [Lactuca saligna]|uniref:Protein FAR1-RELATED SEQUENCE n=1 Tax=Lactuca saligna TaxID=75948 RepID=A0AA35YH12_LACSI|nr:unnamed protein product [Lactuca saligna]
MDTKISTGGDHIHDQHEYPIDYADDDEDFGLANYDSLHNINFEIGKNSNLNLVEDPLEHIQNHIDVNSDNHFGESKNENEFIDDETDYTIVDDNIDLQKEESHITHDYVTPGGSPYWILVVSDHIKPKINSTVDSYGATLSMYKNYTSEAEQYEKSQFLHRFQGCKIPCSQDAGKGKNILTFSFEFKVVWKKLNALFWIDETAKYNYNAFGDVISLDATFNM